MNATTRIIRFIRSGELYIPAIEMTAGIFIANNLKILVDTTFVAGYSSHH